MRLVLASSSPRRADLLRQLGLEFDIEPVDVDETKFPGEDPETYVDRIARAKASAVAGPGRLVVGADTAVVFESKVMGKPGHPEEARSMLSRLQGTTHEVFTGLAVASWDGGVQLRSVVDVTEVEMLPMTIDEIADYVNTGEPLDKAGAYALQGRAARFAKRVSGDPTTVVGLPAHLLARLVAAAGEDLSTFEGATAG